MSRLRPEFEAWHAKQECEYCDTAMSHVSRDGCLINCPRCWISKPVPSQFRYWSQRLALNEV